MRRERQALCIVVHYSYRHCDICLGFAVDGYARSAKDLVYEPPCRVQSVHGLWQSLCWALCINLSLGATGPESCVIGEMGERVTSCAVPFPRQHIQSFVRQLLVRPLSLRASSVVWPLSISTDLTRCERPPQHIQHKLSTPIQIIPVSLLALCIMASDGGELCCREAVKGKVCLTVLCLPITRQCCL